jgi:hypothetical protein
LNPRRDSCRTRHMRVWRMRTGISISLKPADRRRLAALARDRNAPHKHVWRAGIVLLSADGVGTNGAALIMPACNSEAMNLHLAEIAATVAPAAHAILLVDQAGWHLSTRLLVPANILRRSRRPLLCGMERARRPALAHHVHRTAPMGPRVLINGIWY